MGCSVTQRRALARSSGEKLKLDNSAWKKGVDCQVGCWNDLPRGPGGFSVSGNVEIEVGCFAKRSALGIISGRVSGLCERGGLTRCAQGTPLA